MRLRFRHVVNEYSPLNKVHASICSYLPNILVPMVKKIYFIFSKKAFLVFWKRFLAPNLKKNSYISEGNFKVRSLIKIKHLNQFFKVNFHLN